MDDEWLQHVLQDHEAAVELVAVVGDDTPVGLIGLDWSGPDGVVAVTDLAVNPWRRRAGIGRAVLRAAMEWPGVPAAATRWVAYVDPENPDAAAFFSACGWSCEGPDGVMIRWSHTTR